MTLNIQGMEGACLDALVLVALGLDITGQDQVWAGSLDGVPLALVGDPSLSPFLRSPSREWEVGGKLIERNRIGC